VNQTTNRDRTSEHAHPPHRRRLVAALAGTLLLALAACAPVKGGVSAEWTVWDDLAQCEAGGDWAANTGNGYYGGLQFAGSTWNAHGGQAFAPTADLASREEQIIIGERVQAAGGWGQWPHCSSQLGLR
jgi:hypothetical protein